MKYLLEIYTKLKKIIKKVIFKTPYSVVLMFHHISDNPKYAKSGCLLSTKKFLEIIDLLSNVDEVGKVVRNARKRCVAITFDDGLEDVYTVAYPILKEKKMPFTLFVVTDFLDCEGYITTKQLKELAVDPLVTIGAHGTSHKILSSLTKLEQEREIKESSRIIERLTGKKVKYYAYSHGQYNNDTIKLMKEYCYGFLASPNPINVFTKRNSMKIPRYNVDNTTFNEICVLLKSLKS